MFYSEWFLQVVVEEGRKERGEGKGKLFYLQKKMLS